MCGIWLYLVKQGCSPSVSTTDMFNSFNKLKKRGPNYSQFLDLSQYGLYIGFHRLSIMDVSVRGNQPFVIENENNITYLICNGEIYNFRELESKYNIKTQSFSDCEVILYLYKIVGFDKMIKELDGEFAFCLIDIDKKTNKVTIKVGRDHCGIRPIFITGTSEEILLTSEMKGSPFLHKNYNIYQFPPRHYMTVSNFDDILFSLNLNDFQQWKNNVSYYDTFYKNSNKFTQWIDFKNVSTKITEEKEALEKIKETLIKSVRDRMVANRPIGCLLSGGLDSSLVSSIASKYCKEHGTKLKTFSIGLIGGSTDEYYAKMVSKHINSEHTHVYVSEEECLETLNKITYITETFDITTTRASVFEYLIAKYISEHTDIKVLLVGEGSDECYSGYMYFHNAPSSEESHKENIRLIEDIHLYDGLRADRCVSHCGLEVRVPFLSKECVMLSLSLHPESKRQINGMEKYILRKAFHTSNYLPEKVLWRTKEAQSDGCSSMNRSWYQIIQEYISMNESKNECITDYIKPITSEGIYYRCNFQKYFYDTDTNAKVIPYIWMPKWTHGANDPSARTLNIYKNKMQKTDEKI